MAPSFFPASQHMVDTHSSKDIYSHAFLTQVPAQILMTMQVAGHCHHMVMMWPAPFLSLWPYTLQLQARWGEWDQAETLSPYWVPQAALLLFVLITTLTVTPLLPILVCLTQSHVDAQSYLPCPALTSRRTGGHWRLSQKKVQWMGQCHQFPQGIAHG